MLPHLKPSPSPILVIALVLLSEGCGQPRYTDRFGRHMHATWHREALAFAINSTPDTAVDDLLEHVGFEGLFPYGSRSTFTRLKANALGDRFPDFADRVASKAFETNQSVGTRNRLISVLGVLGKASERYIPKIAEIAFGSPGEKYSHARIVAAEALGGIAREVPSVVGLAIEQLKQGSPTSAYSAIRILEISKSNARRAMPILLDRLDQAPDARATEVMLGVIASIDESQIRSSRVRETVLPRFRYAIDAELSKSDLSGEASFYLSWMHKLGADANEVVPMIVRLMAKHGEREPGGGWGALGGRQLIQPYGDKAKPVLKRLIQDADPAIRDVADFLLSKSTHHTIRG